MHLARWVSLASLAALVLLMLGPFSGLEKHLLLTDEAAHFLAFAIITTALFLNLPLRTRTQIVIIAMLLAASIEVVQSVVGRHAEWADLFCGSSPVWLVAAVWPPRRIKTISRTRGARRSTGASSPSIAQPSKKQPGKKQNAAASKA